MVPDSRPDQSENRSGTQGVDAPGAEVAAEPGAPDGVGGHDEAAAGAMEVGQHLAEGEQGSFVGPGAGMRRGAMDEAQGLAALCVEAGADDARSAGKALVLQMPQQGVHRSGPAAGLAVHHVADA